MLQIFGSEPKIADYVILNLDKIGRASCIINVIDSKEEIPTYRFEDKIIVVASKRLDSIVSAITNISRSKVIIPIEDGKILIDYVEEKDKSKNIEIGSVITIKGFGKYKLFCENGETKKEVQILTKAQWVIYFILPLLVVIVGFFIDSFIDASHHLTLFISPLAFGIIIHKMVMNSSNVNIHYFKKLVDTTGLVSSTLSASILIFKTINVENPYISMLDSLKDAGVFSSIIFYIIMALVYIVVWIFATSITIKLMITYDELIAMKNKA